MSKKNIKDLGLKSSALKVFAQLMWASENLKARVVSLPGKYGLTTSQYAILDVLYHMGPRSQKDLGGHILKTGGNITMVVDNLEKNGLVKRERSDKDRRVTYVHITDQGEKLFSEVFPLHIKDVEKEMSVLSPRELDELSRLCVKLVVKQGGDIKK